MNEVPVTKYLIATDLSSVRSLLPTIERQIGPVLCQSSLLATVRTQSREAGTLMVALSFRLRDTPESEARQCLLACFSRAPKRQLAQSIRDLERAVGKQSEVAPTGRPALGLSEAHMFSFETLLTRIEHEAAPLALRKNLTLSFFVELDVPKRIEGDFQALELVLMGLINDTIAESSDGEILLSIQNDPEFTPGSALLLSVSGARRQAFAPSGGSRPISFTVLLPHQEQARPKLLLVDDSPDISELISVMYEDSKLEIESAENGLEALDKISKNDYNLILMDIEMPLMDGLSATREIRASERDHHKAPTPIVALTAHSGEEYAQRISEAGCNGFLRKPIDLDSLNSTLTNYLGINPLEGQGPVFSETA